MSRNPWRTKASDSGNCSQSTSWSSPTCPSSFASSSDHSRSPASSGHFITLRNWNSVSALEPTMVFTEFPTSWFNFLLPVAEYFNKVILACGGIRSRITTECRTTKIKVVNRNNKTNVNHLTNFFIVNIIVTASKGRVVLGKTVKCKDGIFTHTKNTIEMMVSDTTGAHCIHLDFLNIIPHS